MPEHPPVALPADPGPRVVADQQNLNQFDRLRGGIVTAPELGGWGSSPAVRGRWRAKGAGGGAGGGPFNRNECRCRSLILQDVTGANPQDHHPSLRKPCLAALIVVQLSSGIVYEPIRRDRQRSRPLRLPSLATSPAQQGRSNLARRMG